MEQFVESDDVVWEDSNCFWLKDKEGNVWRVLRTPHKEIPKILKLVEGLE